MIKINSYNEAMTKVHRALDSPPTDQTQIKTRTKEEVQKGYGYLGTNFYNKLFLNWGLWDKKIYKEYQSLNYNFSALCSHQDPHSQLLVYYLLRPFIQHQFFNKQIVDVGCGNGIGLKMTSQLLQTNYALGVDLTYPLINNAHANFYEEHKLNYIQGDAESLPIECNSADLVTNIESSHLYPEIECFFTEVARVLKPGGYFCYCDIHFKAKKQAEHLEAFLKTRTDLRVVQKEDITKKVQASIYNRLIVNEKKLYDSCLQSFGVDPHDLTIGATKVANSLGLTFLPWWRIRFKTPVIRPIAKQARQSTFWDRKYYFYYIIQKIR